jgi:nucleoside-diphosphate-sugar epimerase
MKHLVTGGSGFVGSRVVNRLLEEGYQVVSLDLEPNPNTPPSVEYICASITDRAAVAKALRGVKVVHHIAAMIPLAKAESQFKKTNIEGTRILAEEAVRASVECFIQFSSSAIFGGVKVFPITETTSPCPIEAYGSSKLAGEKVAKEIFGSAGIPLMIIRPRTILGPGRLGIFHLLFQWISEGRKIYIPGDGKNRVQLIHIMDLIDAYFLIFRKGESGEFNIGTECFGTLFETIDSLIRYSGTSSRIVHIPVCLTVSALRILDILHLSPLAPFHYRTFHNDAFFDITRLLKMGWHPKYSNEDMLKENYNNYVENRGAKDYQNLTSLQSLPLKEGSLSILKRLF